MTEPCELLPTLIYDAETDLLRTTKDYTLTCSVGGQLSVFYCHARARDETRESFTMRYRQAVRDFLEFIAQHPYHKTVGKAGVKPRILVDGTSASATLDAQIVRSRARNCELNIEYRATLDRLDRDCKREVEINDEQT